MAKVLLGTKPVGSIVKLNVNNALTDFIVVQQGRPSAMYDNEWNNVTTLRAKDIYEKRQWHSSNVNDYANSTIHSYLNNEFLNLLDVSIRNALCTVRIPYRPGSGIDSNILTGGSGLPAKAFLLSAYEAGFTNADDRWTPADGSRFAYFNDGNKFNIPYYPGGNTSWWFRTPWNNPTAEGRCALCIYANFSGMGCNNANGICPALAASSSLLVSDDGVVSVNMPPTVPPYISVPDGLKGGTSTTVSWGASTDPDGNLEGYRLERSVNGGGWELVYQGTALASIQDIVKGWAHITFRVKAYDAMGLESGYATSPTRTIINNSPPTTPSSITVPDGIKGGTSITVSWGGSTDPDSNLEGYRLERSVNSGAWSQVYQGAALSSTQAITKGWLTVAFRVKAYDTPGLESGYATSPTRTIINNSPPTTPPSISYSDPRAGRAIALTCGQSTDPDGDPISYVWERRVDSGVFAQIGITSATSHTDTVPTSGTLYQVRVKAADNHGNESAYYTGQAIAIRYNDPPVISGSNQNLGDLTTKELTYAYTATDDKTANLAVVIRLDGAVYQTLSVVPGAAQTFRITGADWQKILNGSHTLTITATDAEGESDVRTLTFSKNQGILEFKIKEPRTIESRPSRFALNLSAQLPAGCTTTILVCNNALDAAPAWEDITTKTLAGRAHIFANAQRTAGQWAVNLHVKVQRNGATSNCFISGFTYAYETDSGGAAQIAAMSLQLENTEQLLDSLLTDIIPNLMGGGDA